jgi:hypothetical protein
MKPYCFFAFLFCDLPTGPEFFMCFFEVDVEAETLVDTAGNPETCELSGTGEEGGGNEATVDVELRAAEAPLQSTPF